MKIWVHINGVQEGPYELNQLPLDRMDEKTPVWYEGLQYWEPAGESMLTQSLFDGVASTPRRAATADTAVAAADGTEERPATYLFWSLALTIIGLLNPIGILAIVYGFMVISRYNNYDYVGARRASEAAAWCVMLLIVTDLIFMPLSYLILF